MIQEKQNLDSVDTLLFGTPQGIFRTIHRVHPAEFEANLTALSANEPPLEAGISDPDDPSQLHLYSLDRQGNIQRQLETLANLDVRDRPWYRAAVARGQPGWSQPFQIGRSNLLALNAYWPVYDEAQQLQAVFSANITLNRLSHFLTTLRLSDPGGVFIIERSGLIIASSEDSSPYLSRETATGDRAFQRLSPADSASPLIRAAYQYCTTHLAGCKLRTAPQPLNFVAQGDRYFLNVRPYQDTYGLDWLIVTAVPATHFTAAIEANAIRTIALCLLTLLISGALTWQIARWITRPVKHLSQSVQELAAGQFEPPVAIAGTGEVRQLTQSFQAMATQLRQSLQTIQNSEAKLSVLLQSLPVGVWVFNAAGSTLLINQAGKAILGPDNLEEAPLPDLARTHRLFLAGTHQLYPTDNLPVVRAFQGETVEADDLEIEREGQRIRLQVHASPVISAGGTIEYVIQTFWDVTQQHQAKRLIAQYNHTLRQAVITRTRSLAESEARFRHVFERAGVGMALSDMDGHLIAINPAFRALLGYSEAEAKTLTIDDITHPDDPTIELDYLHRWLLDEATHYQAERRYLTATGEIRWVLASVALIVNADDKPQYFITQIQDITRQKQAEMALNESERRFRGAFETSAIGMCLVGLDGTLLDVNPALCDMWGYEKSALLNCTFQAVTHPDDLDPDLALLQQLVGGDISDYQLEKRYIRKNGEIMWAHLSVSLVRDASDKPLYFVSQIQDITIQKQAQDILKQNNRALQRLVRLDRLTQIANLYRFEEQLTVEWQRAAREQQPLALIMLDVDYFKYYNDFYGHPAGDRCLVQIAQVCQQATERPADLVARYGGEEFVLLLPNTQVSGAIAVAERLQQLLEAAHILHADSPISDRITVSLGIACQVPTSARASPQSLIQAADEALYVAKRQGRDRYVIAAL